MLRIFSPQLSEFSGGEASGVDHANESPVVGEIAFTLPVVDVVCVIAIDIEAIQQEGDLATVGCIDSSTESKKGAAGFGLYLYAVVLPALDRNGIFGGITIQAGIRRYSVGERVDGERTIWGTTAYRAGSNVVL